MMNSIIKRLAAPPGILFHLLVFTAVLASWYVAALKGTVDIEFAFALIALWLLVAVTWLFRLALYIGISSKPGFKIATDIIRKESEVGAPMKWKKWLLAPLIVSVTYLSLILNMPFNVAFLISRPQMNELARQVTQSNAPPHVSRPWVGVYRAREVKRVPGGMQFLVSKACFIGGCQYFGFAHSSSGKPLVSEAHYARISENWFWWEEHNDPCPIGCADVKK